MRFTASEAASATNGRPSGPDVTFDGVAFDSRRVSRGQLFVPLVAERDGHDFIGEALAAGAAGYLTSRGAGPGTAITVADTLAALMELGSFGRSRLTGPVVGVTGSVGKTSVKDMIAAVLGTTWRTHANEKSFNNEFGLPSTILNASDDTDVLVTEMGMRGFGQIAELCRIARPTIGVVTRVAGAHSELVGGIEGVRRAKAELIESLPPDGIAVLNADDDRVASMATLTTARCLSFGLTGDVRVERLVLDDYARPSFTVCTPDGAADVRLAISGAHMAVNASAAIAVGLACGVTLDRAVDGVQQTSMSPHRMAMGRTPSGALVIDDSYNANPTSMRAALDTLAALPSSGRKIAVLGVMAEISDTEQEHRTIAAYARDRGIEVVAVGTASYGVEPVGEALSAVGSVGAGDAVLVKGSRVARLEHVVAALVQEG